MRNVGLYLDDIRQSIARIELYTSTGRDAFDRSELIQDAVARNLQIIGEAVKHIPDHVRALEQEIPWTRIAAMRNEITHRYWGTDLNIVWNIIHKELRPLDEAIARMLKILGDPPPPDAQPKSPPNPPPGPGR